MPTAVVTGANNGVGFELAKQLIEKGYKVYATSRTVGPKLQSLNTEHKHQLDVTSPDSIRAFAQTFGTQTLDVLLNNAAISSAPTETLTNMTQEYLAHVFATNTFGPLLLTQALLPNILRADPPARIGNVTSRVGSIADNSSGGLYAYRASKAALNQINKNLSIELKGKGVVVSLLHPGMVESGMTKKTGPDDGVVTPQEAAEKLLGILLGSGIEDTGKFWHRDGYELPW